MPESDQREEEKIIKAVHIAKDIANAAGGAAKAAGPEAVAAKEMIDLAPEVRSPEEEAASIARMARMQAEEVGEEIVPARLEPKLSETEGISGGSSDETLREMDIEKIKFLNRTGKISSKKARDMLRKIKPTEAGVKKVLRAEPSSLFGGGFFTVIFSGVLIFLIFSILISRIGLNLPLFYILLVVYGGIFFLAGWSKR